MSERPSILLMDEDAVTLEQLQSMLQRQGYHVLVAADGHAGLRIAKKTRPNLIVSDLLLAGLDGYEVWTKLRADREMPNIPILIISALTVPPPNTPWRPTPNVEWRLLAYDAHLPKPVDLHRFVRVVKRLLYPDQAPTIPGGPSVMIAIEDREIQETLASTLNQQDFGVEIRSLTRALKLVTAIQPAILLLDYRHQDKRVEEIITQTRKYVPNTVIVLVTDPSRKIETELEQCCDGFLSPPLYSAYVDTVINQVLELNTARRRTEMLSTELITTNRNLLDTQHVLQAQNEELKYINARLRELDRLKEKLTGMVVHDLKAPLASILGALSYLSTDRSLNLSQINQELLTGAMAAVNQMARLTESLLEGQRLEDGHLEPDVEPFDFSTIVDDSLKQVSPLLTLHRLEVKAILPDDLPLVYADPHMSQRILENLLDNAIKFSPRDDFITIRASHEERFIKVSIEDNGPGIPKEQQLEIFEQYAQLKNPGQSSNRGFGLGLTFCLLATQAMGGSIWVESDGASGTDFLFTLPVHED